MGRVALAVVLLAVLLGGLYRLYGPSATSPTSPAPAQAPHKQVVSNAGCSGRDTVVIELSSASVGVPVEGPIGRHDACEGNEIEHMSGEIDWGDGSSSPVVPGKDKSLLVASKHTYASRATFAVFARLRAQCSDGHGQSTRVISCGSGTIQVK
jgi:hypothetical protein